MRNFQGVVTLFVAVGVIGEFGATASSGLQVISDDELVERMRANEFVIALFCECVIQPHKFSNEFPNFLCNFHLFVCVLFFL